MVKTTYTLKRKPWTKKSINTEFKNESLLINGIFNFVKHEVDSAVLYSEIFPTKWERDNCNNSLIIDLYNHFYDKFKDKKKAIKTASQYLGQIFLRCLYDNKHNFIQYKKEHQGINNNSYIRIS